jgi:hypothetical protein
MKLKRTGDLPQADSCLTRRQLGDEKLRSFETQNFAEGIIGPRI